MIHGSNIHSQLRMCYGLRHFLIVQAVEQGHAAAEIGVTGLAVVAGVSSFGDMQVKLFRHNAPLNIFIISVKCTMYQVDAQAIFPRF